ncbi:hypothetical protein [Mycobacterium sp. 48b]|uniref:hypothetical protein n=1 Tax=Mycobacterium sp. 48b TaxID=3400426 RepID=UPI003AAF763D
MAKPLIAAEVIHERALALLDAEGIDGLTTRRLAAELKISTRTLYQQVGNRDILIRALVARHLSQLRMEFHPRDTWEQTAQQWCQGLRDTLFAHPHLTELMTNDDGGAIMGYIDDLIEASACEGIPHPTAVDCARALVNLTINHTVMEVRGLREPKLSRESFDAHHLARANFNRSIGWILAGVRAETNVKTTLVSDHTARYGLRNQRYLNSPPAIRRREVTSHDVETFMNHPLTYCDGSVTKMHSIPRADLEELQREAMARRFAEHRESIEMVNKLATRLGVSSVEKFDDIVPLMFSHTAYKSYPAALLDNKRWDLLTRWLNKLTCYDLSHVDVRGAETIDEWLDCLESQTPVQLVTSSGTTGTFSIIPKDDDTTVEGMHIWKMMVFQTFGKEPTEDELHPAVDIIWPNYSEGRFGMTRMVPWLKREFTGGDESRFHALYSGAMDTDLMFLANKMRAAAAKGELDRLELDPKLAARKDEFIAMQARQATEVPEFLTRLTNQLAGKRVFMLNTYPLMYALASAGLAEGVRANFATNSAILTGGGAKGQVLPENYMDVIREFYGVPRIQEGYSFSEHNGVHFACEQGRYHIQPWVIPFVLDPVTNEPLPRSGRQTGRFAVYDVYNQSHWGGVITGDEVTIEFSEPCPCGRTSVSIDHDIVRFSEKKDGAEDKISCAATHEVQNEAIDFLKEFQG